MIAPEARYPRPPWPLVVRLCFVALFLALVGGVAHADDEDGDEEPDLSN